MFTSYLAVLFDPLVERGLRGARGDELRLHVGHLLRRRHRRRGRAEAQAQGLSGTSTSVHFAWSGSGVDSQSFSDLAADLVASVLLLALFIARREKMSQECRDFLLICA